MNRVVTAAAMFVIVASPALAQSPGLGTQSGASQSPPGASTSSLSAPPAVQKIRQDLQAAGFTDVKVVAESFVVQARSKDGDPVLMTIGPHGMSVFEAMDSSASSSSDKTIGQSSAGGNASSTTEGPATTGSNGAVQSEKMHGSNSESTTGH